LGEIFEKEKMFEACWWRMFPFSLVIIPKADS
jgi:hypothetical protein